ncbi:MAG: threonine synthase [Acidimicrobiales bacterium]
MSVRYVSTRGAAPALEFPDVLLTGLAVDGGLYCPEVVPPLPDLTGLDPVTAYAEVATAVMWPYVEGTIPADEFAALVAAAYRPFRHPAVCPVVGLGDGVHLLDLTQGPTLAFKDVALQLVGRLLGRELAHRGGSVVVIMATSGDTGSAAIEALAGLTNVEAIVLHPEGRVSEVQRRQMTTVAADNIHNLAVEGTFDDCQDLVKAAFGDEGLRHRHGLAAVNSINWARVMAQIVYYVTAARTVAPDGGPVSFAVPTGNFGNVLAGWYAKRMGLDVDRLIVASNRNDVLTRFFETGWLEARDVVPTPSPSMDIQISSNFERLLWEASDRDGPAVARLIATFRSEGRVEVPAPWRAVIGAEFTGGRLDDEGTIAEMRRVHDDNGLLVDPHTAIGIHAARTLRGDPAVPVVALATAAPAKFGEAVERAVGRRPELPPFLAELFQRPERYTVVANDPAAVAEYLDGLGAPTP